MNEKAEKLFTVSWINATQKIHKINQYRRAFLLAEKEICFKFNLEAENFISEMYKGNQYDKLFTDKKGFFDLLGGKDRAIKYMTNLNIDNTKSLLNDSILIFVHSVMDGYVFDLISVIKIISPESFAERYKDRKIKFSDYDKTKEELLEYFIENDKLDRKSLLEKIDLIYILCRPPKNYKPITGFDFDVNELKSLDELRNKIIHENISQSEDQWDFDAFRLSQTLSYFMCLVSNKFGVKISPILWKESFREDGER